MDDTCWTFSIFKNIDPFHLTFPFLSETSFTRWNVWQTISWRNVAGKEFLDLNDTLFLPVASNDPCTNYKNLNAVDRLESFTGQSPLRCDRNDITPGWYRFTGVAGNPQMPTQCVNPTRRCGTHAPGWLDGQHPSVADGEVTRQVCYHWSNNCCRWKNNIKVKNCGAFYVYELQKTPACSLRYCGECQLFINNIVHIESMLPTDANQGNKIA